MSNTTYTLPQAAVRVPSKRIESIDLLRGIIMLIMALDHVRDYFHADAYVFDPTDLHRTSIFLFFTRWITHFCAPIFMLLAGVSASLYGGKNGRKAVSFFLLTRGLWLIFLEVFVVTLEWTFNPHYPAFILQVIWAFGLSMIVLSLLVYLPRPIIFVIGCILVAGHNLLDGVHVAGNGAANFFWDILHEQHFSGFSFGPPNPIVGYPIIPWIGIITLGYCLGGLYAPDYDPQRRKKALILCGLGLIFLFIGIRLFNVYGDAAPWSVQKNGVFTLLSFLNTTKYPPSLLYTLMTIGPALLFLAWSEKPLNALSGKIIVFGRVPMFFYLLHIVLIHGLAVIAASLSGHSAHDMVELTTWVTANPQLKGYGFSLLTVYVVWVAAIVLLYPVSRWYEKYKRTHVAEQPWLSYL
jgi:uncharacterized membrane protein